MKFEVCFILSILFQNVIHEPHDLSQLAIGVLTTLL